MFRLTITSAFAFAVALFGMASCVDQAEASSGDHDKVHIAVPRQS